MYTIRLVGQEDHTQRFAKWLESRGHIVTLNSTRGVYVDNKWVLAHDDAHDIIRRLWSEFEPLDT